MSARNFEVVNSFTSVATGFFENAKYLPRLAALPFVLSVLIAFLDRTLTHSPLPSLGAQLLSVIPQALFAMIWMRLLFFGPSAPGVTALPGFGPAEKNFFSAALIIYGLGAVLVQFALSAVSMSDLQGHVNGQMGSMEMDGMPMHPGMGGFGFILFFAALAYMVFSLAAFFVLPARAAGRNYSFRQSFKDTNGAKFRIFLAAMIIFIPTEIAGSIAATPFLLISRALDAVMPIILAEKAVTYIVLALSAGLMVEAYKTVTGWTPSRNPTT